VKVECAWEIGSNMRYRLGMPLRGFLRNCRTKDISIDRSIWACCFEKFGELENALMARLSGNLLRGLIFGGNGNRN